MYRHLASGGFSWLTPTGVLVAEIGELQGRDVTSLFHGGGWEATVERDWTGRDRFLLAWMER
jgi:methylase of polypeptide subunit release factors